MVQRYVPEIRQGDKRIILIDGKPAGALNRVPAAEETRANLHVGGRAEKAILSKRDHEICEMIGPTLQERGLIFVGIDVIGDYLTEINVTSPDRPAGDRPLRRGQSRGPDLGRDRGQDQPPSAARAADVTVAQDRSANARRPGADHATRPMVASASG